MKNHKLIFILIPIFIIAVFLRIYGLKEQGLFFYDEGAMVNKAYIIKTFLSSKPYPFLVHTSYVDSKILWLFVIGLFQIVFNNAPYAALYASFILGILTVWMTYLFAARFYKSKTIGILSSLFLAISSYHVFFSRIAIAESASTFLLLVSVYLYFRGCEEKKKYIVLAGIAAGLAFLANRFRVGLLPLFILILEIYINSNSGQSSRRDKTRYWIFLLSIFIVVVSGQTISYVLGFFDIFIRPYFYSLKMNFLSHSTPTFSAFSFFVHPFYIFKFEGWANCLLIVSSVFFLKKKYSPALPLAFLLLQMIFSSAVDEKLVRSLSAVLPFISIVCGVVFYNLSIILKESVARKAMLCLICVIILYTGLTKSWSLIGFKSGMGNAVDFLKSTHLQEGIVTTNKPVVMAYSPSLRAVQILQQNKEDLKAYYAHGFKSILIDPQRFITSKLGGHWTGLKYDLVEDIEAKCLPVKIFDHYDDLLFEIFLWEHTTNFINTTRLLGNIPEDAGKIKIYELESCINALEEE